MDLRNGFFIGLIAFLGIIAFLLVAPFLQYVLAAGLLGFVLYPLHRRLAPRLGPRPSAALLTALAVVVAVVPLLLFSLYLVQAALDFLDGIAEEDIVSAVESTRAYLVEELGVEPEHLEQFEEMLLSEFDEIAQSAGEIILTEMIAMVDVTVHAGFGVMLLVFLLYYVLLDGARFVAWVRSVTPLETDVIDELFDEVSVVTWAVVQSHLLVAVVEGILGGIGLWIVGISNVPFWTVVMIVVSILPIIGVWLVWAPAVIYLLATGDMVGALFLLVYGVAVLSVIDNYLRAFFVDHGSGLHPAVVLVGVLGGIYLLGILGLFLGPILLAVFKASVTVFSRNHEDLTAPPPPR